MTKILITGSAGFIGSHLVELLLSKGFEIVGFDNLNDYYDVNLKYGRLDRAGINQGNIKYNELIQSEFLKLRYFYARSE